MHLPSAKLPPPFPPPPHFYRFLLLVLVFPWTDAFLDFRPRLFDLISLSHGAFTSPQPRLSLRRRCCRYSTGSTSDSTGIPFSLQELGVASIRFNRADFPPTPDTLFPASVDYLLTLPATIGGVPFEFTLDTTASVNLVTKEVVEAYLGTSPKASGKKGFGNEAKGAGGGMGGGGGFGGKQDASSPGKGKKGEKKKKKKKEDKEWEDAGGSLMEAEGVAFEITVSSSPPGLLVPVKAVVTEEWTGVGGGCLGLPFLRSFGAVEIDWRRMQGRLWGGRDGPQVVDGLDNWRESEEEGKGQEGAEWKIDFAPLRIKMNAQMALEALGQGEEEEEKDEEGTCPEVWVVDVHLDGSEAGIPAIVDLGCQASILNWKAAEALGYRKPTSPGTAGTVEVQAVEGIEVAFADKTSLSLGQSHGVHVPARPLAIADLPVFAYAGLGQVPAMVLGLDVLGSVQDTLVLDWSQRCLTVGGPLLPVKRNQAAVDMPLIRREQAVERAPAGGQAYQYGVPAVLGGTEKEVVLMVDTAAGCMAVSQKAWETYADAQGGREGGPAEGQAVDMAGIGPGKGLKARRQSVTMHLGGSSVREGYELTTEVAVLEGGREGGKDRFDGFLGQSFFGAYAVVDFDWRHAMLRCYSEEKTEGEKATTLDGLLDFWPPSPLPTSTPPSASPPPNPPQAARLHTGVARDRLGPNALMSVTVVVNGRKDVPCCGLIDTGAFTSVLNWAAARALGVGKEGEIGVTVPARESGMVVVGLDGAPTEVTLARFDEVAFEGEAEGGREGGAVVVPTERGGVTLAVADLLGLQQLGLLETPAMIVGLDLLEGGRGGRLILDLVRGRLFLA